MIVNREMRLLCILYYNITIFIIYILYIYIIIYIYNIILHYNIYSVFFNKSELIK